ncbi:MAG: ATP-binding protein [Syntrophales bacterium]|nr:ATP-binding protein [Syntrophales bacterium]
MRFAESENVELKESTFELKEGIISLVAMLNKHHRGELWFGMRNDGIVVGQSVSEKSLREVSRAISDNVEPKVYPTIEQALVDGKQCIRVLVEGKDSPYFAYGRAYIRIGDEPAIERQRTGEPDTAKKPRPSPLGHGTLRPGDL